MLYFKNTELAKKYHVSLGTVRNWIVSAERGKLDLALHDTEDRKYILKTATNTDTMNSIVEERKKFRNSNAVKRISPSDKFYNLFSKEQVYDIATNLEIHHEVPLQYNYFNSGARAWNDHMKRLADEDVENSFSATQALLETSMGMLDSLLSNYDRVNIVDIGPGNAMPSRWLLEYLHNAGKLGKYIAIDISPDMLKIAEKNIQKWFNGDVKFEGYTRNVNQDRFADLLISDYFQGDKSRTVNIVLHLGYTLRNMQRPENGYRTIYDSIGKDDLLIEDNLLDTADTREHLDFSASPSAGGLFFLNALFVPLLGFKPSHYEVIHGFDKERSERFSKIKLKVAIEIEFKIKGGGRIISLNKDDHIIVWRNRHYSARDIIEQRANSGFSLLYSSQTESQEHMLSIFRVLATT